MMTFCGSRSAGISTTERMPARAAAAATAFARLPVEGQASTLKPISSAAARETATTRSLNEWVGLPRSSLIHRRRMPSAAARLSARISLVQPGSVPGELRDVGPDRQQAGVPPHARRPGLDVRPGQAGKVVADLKRPETLRAGVVRAEPAAVPALPAGQPGGVPERRAAAGHGGVSADGGDRGRAHGTRASLPHLSRGHPGRGSDLAPVTSARASGRLVVVAGASQGRSLHPSG